MQRPGNACLLCVYYDLYDAASRINLVISGLFILDMWLVLPSSDWWNPIELSLGYKKHLVWELTKTSEDSEIKVWAIIGMNLVALCAS
jgi:hypothetical protein